MSFMGFRKVVWTSKDLSPAGWDSPGWKTGSWGGERKSLPLRGRWLARKGETEEGEIERLQKCIDILGNYTKNQL